METLLYECSLCPRCCGAHRVAGERGFCGADDRMYVARVALHYWEEPPISGSSGSGDSGSGAPGSGTIFFSHCSLRCVYCQNAPVAQGVVGEPVDIAQLSSLCLDLQREGALNINLVTPTHYAPQIREAITQARSLGLRLPVIWNTSGYETVATVEDNDGVVDIYLTDFKYASSELAAKYSGAFDYPQRAISALDAMVSSVGSPVFDIYRNEERLVRGVVVRHLLLPGALEDSRNVVELLHHRYGDQILLSLMNQYTPLLATRANAGDLRSQDILRRYPELAHRVPGEDYEALLDFADSLGIERYFWQEEDTAEESFVPQWTGAGLVT